MKWKVRQCRETRSVSLKESRAKRTLLLFETEQQQSQRENIIIRENKLDKYEYEWKT